MYQPAHLSISSNVWEGCEVWQLIMHLLPWCSGFPATRSSASTCSTEQVSTSRQQAQSPTSGICRPRGSTQRSTASSVQIPQSARQRKPPPRAGACRKNPGAGHQVEAAASPASVVCPRQGFAALGGSRSEYWEWGRTSCPWVPAHSASYWWATATAGQSEETGVHGLLLAEMARRKLV